MAVIRDDIGQDSVEGGKVDHRYDEASHLSYCKVQTIIYAMSVIDTIDEKQRYHSSPLDFKPPIRVSTTSLQSSNHHINRQPEQKTNISIVMSDVRTSTKTYSQFVYDTVYSDNGRLKLYCLICPALGFPAT